MLLQLKQMTKAKTNPMQELSSSVAPSASNSLSSLARRSPVYVADVPAILNIQPT